MVNAYRVIACAAALACVATLAKAAQYDSPKALLMQAIDAPDGKASGEIVGPVAERFRQATGSSAPVLAEVSTIKSFQQEGCKRLQLRLRQGDVTDKEGRRGEIAFTYDFNLCQVPDDCIDPRRRALFIGRETMRELIEELRRQKS